MESTQNDGGGTADRAGEELGRELAELKKKNEDLLTRLKYAQADLENYRKRMEKELKEAGEVPARTLAARLLVVQDELDLALKHATEGEGRSQLAEGIRMVKSNLRAALESAGVERIEALGKPFDPAVHEAVEKVQGDEGGPDMVVEEVRPGYTFRGQLLRPSMVKVELMRAAGEEAKVNE